MSTQLINRYQLHLDKLLFDTPFERIKFSIKVSLKKYSIAMYIQ